MQKQKCQHKEKNFRFSKKMKEREVYYCIERVYKESFKTRWKTDIEQLKNTLKTVIETIDSSLENNQFQIKCS